MKHLLLSHGHRALHDESRASLSTRISYPCPLRSVLQASAMLCRMTELLHLLLSLSRGMIFSFSLYVW